MNGAVKFLHIARTGPLVKAVYILGNNALYKAALLQFGNYFVGFVGGSFVHIGKENLFHFFPRFGRVHMEKIDFYILGVVLVPQSALAGKGRDSAFHAYARPGKHHAVRGVLNQFGCRLNILVHRGIV